MSESQSTMRNMKLESLLRLDFYRLFRSPALYIMLAIAAMIPALLATTSGGESGGTVYTNVWALVESLGGSAAGANPLDFSGYANINMVFIFAGLLMSIFISHDYSSGFVKNIFTVHARKRDYVISKTIVGMFGGIGMLLTYVLGSAVSGMLLGLSFEVDLTGLVFCMISKAFLMAPFCAFFLCISVLFKSKLWLTIIFTFLLGMILYPAASVATLGSTIATVFLCALAGVVGGGLFGMVASVFLKHRDLL